MGNRTDSGMVVTIPSTTSREITVCETRATSGQWHADIKGPAIQRAWAHLMERESARTMLYEQTGNERPNRALQDNVTAIAEMLRAGGFTVTVEA